MLIRHYFNTVHARKGNPHWTWLGALVLFIIIIWLSTAPKLLTGEPKESAAAQIFVASAHFPRCVTPCLAAARCAMRLSPSMRHLPCAQGVMLDTDANIAEHAREIYLQAGRSHATATRQRLADIGTRNVRCWWRWYEGAGH